MTCYDEHCIHKARQRVYDYLLGEDIYFCKTLILSGRRDAVNLKSCLLLLKFLATIANYVLKEKKKTLYS